MIRTYNTKSRGLVPIDGYPDLNAAYGPWVSTEACTTFWKEELALGDVPVGATCAVVANDGTITKYHYEKHGGVGTWVEENSATGSGTNVSIDEEVWAEALAALAERVDLLGRSMSSLGNVVDKSIGRLEGLIPVIGNGGLGGDDVIVTTDPNGKLYSKYKYGSAASKEVTDVLRSGSDTIPSSKAVSDFVNKLLNGIPNIQVLNKSDYDSIAQKDPNTLYFLYDDET